MSIASSATKMASLSQNTILLYFIALRSFSISATAQVPKNETFSYVNEGEFGPYVTEYDASYRVLPLAASPFQLCFYNTTPGKFYLAVRMGTVRSESLFRWVWEANRGNPVREKAAFSLRSSGDLVLAEADGRVVWSTNTAGKGVVACRLLNDGNLVLLDSKGNFVWQSFDHPTDTLLVGQSLRPTGPRGLVSRKSETDGSWGIYSLELESGGLGMYINNVSNKPISYHNYSDGFLNWSGKVKSVTFKSETETDDKFAYENKLVVNAEGGGGSYILGRPKYDSRLSMLRLQVDGNLVVYTYYDPVDYRAWERTFALFSDKDGWLSTCLLPSRCGNLGVCQDEMCVACPTKRGLLGWSKECAPPLQTTACGGRKVGQPVDYYKVTGVVNFLSSSITGEGAVGLIECRRRCTADCKCLGFMYFEELSKCWLAPVLGTLSKVAASNHVAYIKYS